MRRKLVARKHVAYVASTAMAANLLTPVAGFAAASENTLTPIKHLIIIVGENRSFDHVFATYKPVHKHEKVLNLLSEGIVNADGSPGPNYGDALQYKAFDFKTFNLTPPKTPYVVLPPVLVGATSTPYVCIDLGFTTGTSCVNPANLAAAARIENGLPRDYIQYLLTGGTGQTNKTPDNRIFYNGQGANHLPPGPFQLTSKTLPYDAYAASPVHRLFQMLQQADCDAQAATEENGFGCRSDLFPWVEATIGAGSNGKAPPASHPETQSGEGAISMGFFNVQTGDVPYFKRLADTYSMSDNFYQSVMGGTGANHITLGTGDSYWFSDGNGNAEVPPNNPVNPSLPGTPPNGISALNEIENPNPQPSINNYYTQDGYGGGSGSPTAVAPSANYGGGSYVNCSDPTQPGVPTVLNYLSSLPRPVNRNCASGHYYLVNNYNPGYFGDGTNAYTDPNADNFVYTIPPSSVRTIGDALLEQNISWAYMAINGIATSKIGTT